MAALEFADPAELVIAHDDALELLASLMRPPAWHAFAACAGMGTRTFFPERGESSATLRRICTGCPVRVDCAATALADVDAQGWWAATSTRLRRSARAEGWSVVTLLEAADQAAVRDVSPSTWQTAPCEQCGGHLSRKDLDVGDGYCWACRDADLVTPARDVTYEDPIAYVEDNTPRPCIGCGVDHDPRSASAPWCSRECEERQARALAELQSRS